MTLPAWPSTVPTGHVEGTFTVQATTAPPLSTDMNAGTTRRRRKFTLRIASVSFDLLLSNAQAADLQSFHETTLGDGAARFTMALIWRGASVTRTAAFAAPPAYRSVGPKMQRVSLSLLVEALG